MNFITLKLADGDQSAQKSDIQNTATEKHKNCSILNMLKRQVRYLSDHEIDHSRLNETMTA